MQIVPRKPRTHGHEGLDLVAVTDDRRQRVRNKGECDGGFVVMVTVP
jgi:hypothetical protein